jgi:hypothetical protein
MVCATGKLLLGAVHRGHFDPGLGLRIETLQVEDCTLALILSAIVFRLIALASGVIDHGKRDDR